MQGRVIRMVADTIFQEKWIDKQAADEMSVLLAVRAEVLGMLEAARQDKCVSCFRFPNVMLMPCPSGTYVCPPRLPCTWARPP